MRPGQGKGKVRKTDEIVSPEGEPLQVCLGANLRDTKKVCLVILNEETLVNGVYALFAGVLYISYGNI